MSQFTMASPPASPRTSWQQRIRESRFGTVLILAVTAAIVMGGAFLVDHPTAAAGVTAVKVAPGDGPAPKIGSTTADFTATTTDGKQVSLSSFKGHPVWLTFGASWCSACVAEAPDIETAYQSFKAKGGVVLAIFISEDSASVRDYATRIGLTFPKVADPDSRVASLYRVYGIPAHFFIDKAGVLRSTKTGGLSTDQMASALAGITQ